MTAPSSVDRIKHFLETGSSSDLAAAFQRSADFCRKHFSMEALLSLYVSREVPTGSASDSKGLRDEIVRRLLVTANRSALRATFLHVLDHDGATKDPLYRFVSDLYYTSESEKFPLEEGRFLNGLRTLLAGRTDYGSSAQAALSFLNASPGTSSTHNFHVILPNEPHYSGFPKIMAAGIAARFTIQRSLATQPFGLQEYGEIPKSFSKMAMQTEELAFKTLHFGRALAKHTKIHNHEDEWRPSVMDGEIAFLPFLMAHCCRFRGFALPPYVGFAGRVNEFKTLSLSSHLPPIVSGSIAAGVRVLFVPQDDLDLLASKQIPDQTILRIMPYRSDNGIESLAKSLLAELERIRETITPHWGPHEENIEKARPPVRIAVPIDEGPLLEPKKLYKPEKLKNLMECGGFDGLQSPAKMSVFNPEDDSFVALFPQKNRVYRFNSFGALLSKYSTESPPLSVIWNGHVRQFVIGFENGRIGSFDLDMQPTGGFMTLPSNMCPRLMACSGKNIFVSDMTERLAVVYNSGTASRTLTLDYPINHLMFFDDRDELVLGCKNVARGFTSDLEAVWELRHPGATSVCGVGAAREIWIGLSTGHLWRLDKDNTIRINIDIPPQTRSIVAFTSGVIVGTVKGEVLLYDDVGTLLGKDDLDSVLLHICATDGDMLVLSMAKGVTVVKPNPQALLRFREKSFKEEALSVLIEWEKITGSAHLLHPAVSKLVGSIDPLKWERIFAFQEVFLARKKQNPAACHVIEQAMKFSDPHKALLLCSKTKPVIIDGSNVTRFHWRGNITGQQSRLSNIDAVKRALAREHNPVPYPVIVVVDSTERQTSDDKASLARMIEDGEIYETPGRREADALILNMIKGNGWMDCQIVTNDRKLLKVHKHMLPRADEAWYERVRRAFTINPVTGEVYFPEETR